MRPALLLTLVTLLRQSEFAAGFLTKQRILQPSKQAAGSLCQRCTSLQRHPSKAFPARTRRITCQFEAFSAAAAFSGFSQHFEGVGSTLSIPFSSAVAFNQRFEGVESLFVSFLVLTFVIAVHEAGHFLAAVGQNIRVKSFSIGFGPELLSVGPEHAGEEGAGVRYSFRAIPVGGFVSFPKAYEEGEDGSITEIDDPDLLQNRPPFQRAIVVGAGVFANLLLTLALTFCSAAVYGEARPQLAPGVVLSSISDPSGAAAVAGLRSDDVLLELGGERLPASLDALDRAVGIVRDSNGRALDVKVLRNSGNGGGLREELTLAVKPRLVDRKYTIGCFLAPNTLRMEVAHPRSFGEAANAAIRETDALIVNTVAALRRFVSTGNAEGMAGPVGVVKQGASMARRAGLPALLQFAAAISINLAIINALPFPGLDGGQMMFILAEAIRGRRISYQVVEVINGVALLLLIAASASSVVGDLGGSALLRYVASEIRPGS